MIPDPASDAPAAMAARAAVVRTGGQLDPGGPTSRLPLHARGRPDLLAADRRPTGRRHRPGAGGTGHRPRRGRRVRGRPAVALAALAARLSARRPRLHADARALLAGRPPAPGATTTARARRSASATARSGSRRPPAPSSPSPTWPAEAPRATSRPTRSCSSSPASRSAPAIAVGHEPVPGRRRPGRGDGPADPRPRAAGVQGRAAARRPRGRLRRQRPSRCPGSCRRARRSAGPAAG